MGSRDFADGMRHWKRNLHDRAGCWRDRVSIEGAGICDARSVWRPTRVYSRIARVDLAKAGAVRPNHVEVPPKSSPLADVEHDVAAVGREGHITRPLRVWNAMTMRAVCVRDVDHRPSARGVHDPPAARTPARRPHTAVPTVSARRNERKCNDTERVHHPDDTTRAVQDPPAVGRP